MNTKRDSRSKRSGTALALVATLALATVPLAAQTGKGATVVVTMRDSEQVTGELISVRPSSLLLLIASGSDRTLDLAGVKSVRVVRRSKAGIGALSGIVLGSGVGAVAASVGYRNADPCESAVAKAGIVVLGGLAGLVIGVVSGGSAGRDLTIPLYDTEGLAREASLRRLRKFARAGAGS